MGGFLSRAATVGGHGGLAVVGFFFVIFFAIFSGTLSSAVGGEVIVSIAIGWHYLVCRGLLIPLDGGGGGDDTILLFIQFMK